MSKINLDGKPKVVYLMQLDEVRYDHLSVYGYKKRQKTIEGLANDGIVFEECIAGSSYTGACTPIINTGMIGPHTGCRDPFSVITAKRIAQYMKESGYRTIGAMSQSCAGSAIGMDKGFNRFIEPESTDAEDTWGDGVKHWQELGVDVDERFKSKPVGKWYLPDVIEYIGQHKDEPMYVYTQFYETHTDSEEYLKESGKIPGENPKNAYYDEKIQLADKVIGKVVSKLKRLGVYEDSLIIVTSDHGTNLREDSWPFGDYVYEPSELGDLATTHNSLYDVDIHVPLIVKLPGNINSGTRVPGQVRAYDITPTILDIVGYPTESMDFDGKSLVPTIEEGRAEGRRAYIETVWSDYGMGARQAIREENWKYIRYLSHMHEEFFLLDKDPKEQVNKIDVVKKFAPKFLKKLRNTCNRYFRAEPKNVDRPTVGDKEKKEIKNRLRALGYLND